MADKREPLKLNDDNWLEWRAETRGKLYLEKVQKSIIKPVEAEEAKKTADVKAKDAENDELVTMSGFFLTDELGSILAS